MPNHTVPTGQDWDPVTLGRPSTSGRATVPKTAKALTAAKASGAVVTERKHGAASNASAHSNTVMSARKLEETDELKHSKVDKSLSKAIMQARTAKKLTQKDLATAINEKPQVIAEYESGKAIPNPQIISKIERKLGCKLPRPGEKPASSSSSSSGSKTGTGGTGGVKTGTAGSGIRPGVTRGGPPKRR